MTKREGLVKKVNEVIKNLFVRYPFKKPLDKWSVKKLGEFLRVWDKR